MIRTRLSRPIYILILPVFVLYSAGHALKRNNWHIGWRRWVIVTDQDGFPFSVVWPTKP